MTKESALARSFHGLGEQKDRNASERFEVVLLERRLNRALAEQKVADALEDLARHLDDDALATAETSSGRASSRPTWRARSPARTRASARSWTTSGR
ncbi:hypothetical protein WMF28_05500 [Sorangium sp. So ce590]|uniref:hypothetical protein n=1 Tax=Sorangium sp. So ce590 TaxID=3133317 RepID=UPI003F621492